jgi:hypothetical protein
MPLMEAVTFIVVGAATGALVVVMVLVVAGIRREERIMTMTRRKAPGQSALLTRRILGLYVRKANSGSDPTHDPDEPVRRFERSR